MLTSKQQRVFDLLTETGRWPVVDGTGGWIVGTWSETTRTLEQLLTRGLVAKKMEKTTSGTVTVYRPT